MVEFGRVPSRAGCRGGLAQLDERAEARGSQEHWRYLRSRGAYCRQLAKFWWIARSSVSVPMNRLRSSRLSSLPLGVLGKAIHEHDAFRNLDDRGDRLDPARVGQPDDRDFRYRRQPIDHLLDFAACPHSARRPSPDAYVQSQPRREWVRPSPQPRVIAAGSRTNAGIHANPSVCQVEPFRE
jgi:hypothetical protein